MFQSWSGKPNGRMMKAPPFPVKFETSRKEYFIDPKGFGSTAVLGMAQMTQHFFYHHVHSSPNGGSSGYLFH